MADVLVDTNVLLRRVQRSSPQHAAARAALRELYARGDSLCIGAQILQEFRCVATRSAQRGGLALTPNQTTRPLHRLRSLFRVLPDGPALYREWEALATTIGITDTEAFDARLVALMKVNGISTVLTFNGTDFHRFPGITVLEPASV